MLFEAEKNDEVLLSKKVVLILNKRDLLNDEEILREYKSTLYAELQTFFREKGLAKIEEGLLEANTFVTSAGTYYGVGELLRKFAELLQKSEDNGYHPEVVFDEASYYEEYDEEETAIVTEITETEKSQLIEQGYIEALESRFAKVWLVQNREICKMVFTIPR